MRLAAVYVVQVLVSSIIPFYTFFSPNLLILNKGYFAIGRYSDYGVIALKLTDDENKEGEILLFDYETPETEVLAPFVKNFFLQFLIIFN